MAKVCQCEGCERNVWGKGYCLIHQYMREDKKTATINQKSRTPLNRTPIRKVSKKKLKTLGEGKLTQMKDWEFYLSLWEEREHICSNCNVYLGSEPATLFFDHICEKGIHDHLRYEPDNIWFLCWSCHTDKGMAAYSPLMKEKIISTHIKFNLSPPKIK